ncbi:hypothetical protein [Haladaptatus sp. NG-SE-30]
MLTAIAKRVRSEPTQGMLIDEQLPTYDATQRRHIVVDTPPAETYAAIEELDLMQTGAIVRILTELRMLPERIQALRRGDVQPKLPDSAKLTDLTESGIWVLLDEQPGEELVLGAVGAVWQPNIEWVEIDADDFRAFDRPGYAKLAIGFSVRQYGATRSLVTYEARTATTDRTARTRFRRYWLFIGPFAGYLMGRALARIKADVEEHHRI